VGLLAWWVLASGCASTGTGGAPALPPPIPEGKGRLILDAGSIPELNYYLVDQATEQEVYSQTPRMSARSPSAYESGSGRTNLQVDLPPGTYTLVVSTDIKDEVKLPDVEVRMGEERYVQVPVGRFQLMVQGSTGLQQLPFLILDYNLRTVLGNGLTSPEVRHFILPVGEYKVRLQNTALAIDEIRPVQVGFGRVTPIMIQLTAPTPEAPTETQPTPQGQP
jgi:hypothetical protein